MGKPAADRLDQLGAIVRRARGSLSLRDFGKLVGVQHSTIGSIEKGDTEATPQTLRKIAPHTPYSAGELIALLNGPAPEAVEFAPETLDGVYRRSLLLPPSERRELIHRLVDNLCALPSVLPRSAAEFRDYLFLDPAHVQAMSLLPVDRIEAIASGNQPTLSEIVSLARCWGEDGADWLIKLLDIQSKTQSPPTAKAAHSAKAPPGPPPSGKGKAKAGDQRRAPTADRRSESAEPPESG
jgi:transcriptional regulator with XRE-family HTH domain